MKSNKKGCYAVAPLYSALVELKRKNQLSFHMPGHSGEDGMEGFSGLVGLDTTEVPESDNLFFANGAIAEAERAAAGLFGAKKVRFLVNGSSGGILAMTGAVLNEGDKIICDRFCHRSFISALIFSGARPIWLCPERLDNGRLWGGINPAEVDAALTENPDAKAVYITSPNYFGLCSDIEKIAEITHRHGALLLVDAAHGAHFSLSPLLPPSAIKCGADAAVISAHKTLPALTQSAFLCLNTELPRLEAMLKMHQSSSPSYVLMASLDYARARMEAEGCKKWTELAENVLEVFPEQAETHGKYVRYKDPTRIVLPLKGDPFAAAERLRLEHGISVECSYGGGVVCITNISHTKEQLIRLKTAADEINRTAADALPLAFAPVQARATLTPKQAFFAETEEVTFNAAIGRIAAREALVYPPGVAQIMPGEEITYEALQSLRDIIALGGEVHGAEGEKLTVVKPLSPLEQG